MRNLTVPIATHVGHPKICSVLSNQQEDPSRFSLVLSATLNFIGEYKINKIKFALYSIYTNDTHQYYINSNRMTKEVSTHAMPLRPPMMELEFPL